MTTKKIKDHREIGRELDLFMFHEYAPGAVFWLPRGWIIYKTLVDFIRLKIDMDGYQEVSTPILVKKQLFVESGHWDYFGEHNMFNLAVYGEEEAGQAREVNYSLKPMNCPEAALIFRAKTRSYQDLPIRLSDFGVLHRKELSGVIGGLLRVFQFTIDDAHLFVRPDQIQREIEKLINLISDFYKSLGFKPHFYLATKPDKAMGDAGVWQEAEGDLETALKDAKVDFDIKPKDGAFYGPKIDIHIQDSQDRDWQLATIQLDFQIPQRMKLEYADRDGKKRRPVMIHRAITGSLERFIGILIEHFQGAFPVWLAPVQAIVLPLSDKFVDYGQKIASDLKLANIRVEVDERNETLQAKIRDATVQKIPYLLIVGAREKEKQAVAVRTREGEDRGQVELQKFKLGMLTKIDDKS